MIYAFDILEKTLQEVGESLQEKVTVYLIGGGALSFKKIKESTKDLDLVFISEKQLEHFEKAIKKKGYKQVHKKEPVYGVARAVYERSDSPSFDLFLNKVFSLALTKKMRREAEDYKAYSKLHIKLISNEAIFIFKLMAGRPGDKDDCIALIHMGLDYKDVRRELDQMGEEAEWAYVTLVELRKERNIQTPLLRTKTAKRIKRYKKIEEGIDKTAKAMRQKEAIKYLDKL